MIYYVNSHWLNIREAPDSSEENIITAIPYGQEIRKMTEHHEWWFAGTYHQNQYIEGFVHSTFLKAGHSQIENIFLPRIPKVDLTQSHATAGSEMYDKAYPITASDRPVRNPTSANTRVRSILAITEYLEKVHSDRYEATTYLNLSCVYAHDFVHLCGGYLPRVWWNEAGLLSIVRDHETQVRYGITVSEMNDNQLYDWLYHWGHQFGWNQVFDLNLLQEAANDGKVCLICAKGRLPNATGHICVVLPETSESSAVRKEGIVKIPRMSQVGKDHLKLFDSRWWMNEKYGFFGFWIHD